MKITNLKKDKQFQLEPGAQLEIERTNPFFNDYGEQSVPMDIPASPHNCLLLDYPEQFGHRGKAQPIDVHIQDGEYSSACRMAVLSAQREGTLSVNFYMNDGSFYSRIQNVRLKDIFGDEKVAGVNTVDQAISFCRTLRANNDERFACFPVLVTDDSGMDTGANYKVINGFGKDDPSYGFLTSADTGSDFFGATERTEYLDGKPIRLSKGYYISPFIRANYLLRRVFQYFGYTMEENFFTQTLPFSKMVVVNNVIDTIVNGYIKLADLVPEVTVGEYINMYRKRFCCEFVANEGKRTVSLKLFKDILNPETAADLSKCLIGKPTFSFNQSGDFKRVVLKTEEKVASDVEDGYDNIKDLMKQDVEYFLETDGSICKAGYCYKFFGMNFYEIHTKVGESSMDYNTGEDGMDEEEITCPDVMPELRPLVITPAAGESLAMTDGSWLYVGDYRTLNSKIVMDAASESQENTEEADKQYLMLAFPVNTELGTACGTTSEYMPTTTLFSSLIGNITPLWDYSLHFYGERGIYERFWRDYDNLMRNGLQKVKAKLLLTQTQKQNLPAHELVFIGGVAMFFDKLKFTLGEASEPQESELLTASIEPPANYAPTPGEMFKRSSSYYWLAKSEITEMSKSEYENAGDKEANFTVVYPPRPSAEYTGKRMYVQTSAKKRPNGVNGWGVTLFEYMHITFWLECLPR